MESKKQATAAQITAIMDYMQENPELSKGVVNSALEREEMEFQWKELSNSLNAMGGSIKSVEKWKQTWRDLKSNTKKKQKNTQDSGGSANADISYGDALDEDYEPPKKKYVGFDEELLRIEKEKLNVDKDYKTKKLDLLNRIAIALEKLASKKD